VPYRGSVEGTISELMGGVRSVMTYIGAVRLKEVPKRTTFIMVGSQLNTAGGDGQAATAAWLEGPLPALSGHRWNCRSRPSWDISPTTAVRSVCGALFPSATLRWRPGHSKL